MMAKNKQDNEVYILGSEPGNNKKKEPKRNLMILLCILLLFLSAGIILFINRKEQTPEYYFEPEQSEPVQQDISVTIKDNTKNQEKKAFIEMSCESPNDIPLLIYAPHNATMSLMVGMPNESDSTVIFAAMAADIRKDNLQIVGDFVLSGKQLARGIAKKGYAAIIDNKITIGTGETTPLLQQAIEYKGSFFRQYPLVSNGELMENKPQNKSIRRALAVRDGQIVMVQSKERESFHDFSRAMIDIGITDAIYLVGGDSYGWYYDIEHVRHEFGKKLDKIPENISYIIWQ